MTAANASRRMISNSIQLHDVPTSYYCIAVLLYGYTGYTQRQFHEHKHIITYIIIDKLCRYRVIERGRAVLQTSFKAIIIVLQTSYAVRISRRDYLGTLRLPSETF